MEVNRQTRWKVGALVSRMRAAEPSYFGEAPTDGEGREVFVPVLWNDPVVIALRLLRQAGGSGLVIAVDWTDHHPSSLGIARVTTTEVHAEHDDDCDVPVGPGTTVGQLFEFFAPGASVSIRLAGDELSLDDLHRRDLDDGSPGRLVDA